MKKSIRIILALVLAGSMLLPLAACRKTKSTKHTEETISAEDISPDDESTQDTEEAKNQSETQKASPARPSQEEDAYFRSECAELRLEPIPDVEFDTTVFSNSSIVGDRILVNLLVSLKDKSMEEKVLEKNYQTIGDNVYTSLQLFDLTGKNIATIAMDDGCEFMNAFALENGEILVVASKFNDGECKSSPAVFAISPSGEKLRDLTFDVSSNLYGSHVYPMENGNIFIAVEGKLFLFDSEGNLIKENSELTLGPFMNYSEGKWFVAHMAVPSTEIAGFQEVDINTGELLQKYPSNRSISIDLANNTECFVFTEKGILKYLITENMTEPVLSSMNTNLEFTDLKNCQILPDGSMIVLNSVPNIDTGTEETDYFRCDANRMSVARLTRADKNAPEET